MKISQSFFGSFVVLTKNELTKICNEPDMCVKISMILGENQHFVMVQ
jgi:hypothetical protein